MGLTLLERLEVADRRLTAIVEKEPYAPYWRFNDWTSCTCGQIYTACVGREAPTKNSVLYEHNSDFEEALGAVARANRIRSAAEDDEWHGDHEQAWLAFAISEQTTRSAVELNDGGEPHDLYLARAALKLVHNAVVMVRAEQEEAREAVARWGAKKDWSEQEREKVQ